MQDFTKKEIALFRKLNTPSKVQDFLNTIPFNFEVDGKDVIKSPLYVMRANNAHCIEGAILGAYILSLHGHKPYIMNLRTTAHDLEHVVVPFKVGNLWGCLSKTNHAVLRYRDPVYRSIRELVMSYFNEYYLDDGTKTLRQYSNPINLNIFKDDWYKADYDLWSIDDELDSVMYHDIAPKNVLKNLRKADVIEREMGKIVDWKKGTKGV